MIRCSGPRLKVACERALHGAAQAAGLDENALNKDGCRRPRRKSRPGALSIHSPADAVFAYVRSIAPRPEPPAAWRPDPERHVEQKQDDALLRDLKRRLKDAIGAANVLEYEARWIGESVSTGHLDQLCRDVATNLRRVIDEEIARLTSVLHLDREVMAHATFAAERRASFTGRARYLDAIAGYLASDSPSAFVVYGDGGTGKSALLAEAAHRARSENSRAVVIERYIGATPACREPAIAPAGSPRRNRSRCTVSAGQRRAT